MKSLIQKLQKEGVLLQVIDNKLKVFAQETNIDTALVQELKENKEQLKEYLLKNEEGLQVLDKTTQIIPKAKEAKSYPLSSTQYRLWVLSQIEASNVAYNMPNTYSFEGDLNLTFLEKAFSQIIERHEILRTRFIQKESDVRQYVVPFDQIAFEIKQYDLRGKQPQEKLLSCLQKEQSYSFDLENDLLLKSTIFQLEDNQWVFFFMTHHIISDGWSSGVLVNELLENYTALEQGEVVDRTALRIQYKDYAVWQKNLQEENHLQEHEAFWIDQFQGEIPKITLPSSQSRPTLKTYNGKTVQKKISKEITEGLRNFCTANQGTLFIGLQTVLKILLNKFTNQTDIVVGTPVAGRIHKELHNQLGLYLNTIALRSEILSVNSFSDVFSKIKEQTLQAYKYQEYPFDRLVENLQLSTDLSRSPLFDVFMILQNNEKVSVKSIGKNLRVDTFEMEVETGKFDLLFNFEEVGEEIELSLVYNTDIYENSFADQMTNHFEELLKNVLSNPESKIENYTSIEITERKTLLEDFNNTQVVSNVREPLQVLFEKQVEKFKDTTAIIYKNEAFSFDYINQKANQLARYFVEQQAVIKGDLVGICLDRSEWMIISILATLKAGAAYVPIDPGYPEERKKYIVEDSQCKYVVDFENIETIKGNLELYEFSNITNTTNLDDTAYVIYTSGSTGNPKGCVVPHKGVINRIDWMWNAYSYTNQDVILQKTTFTFDVSVWEIFMPLCWGTKMILCEQNDIADPERIVTLIDKYQVTCLHFVPSMLNVFIKTLITNGHKEGQLESLRAVITSGEALPVTLVKEWYQSISNAPIHNLYGPTEASIDVTHFTTSVNDEIIPIGKPIWNTQMYVLDEQHNLQPQGVVGEICIGGVGLAKGYLNNQELTNQKFVSNPFVSGQKMYKTGDLGRWLPDGNIEFIGRKDYQVKIRGFRIELGEIEATLLDHEGVQSAVVLVQTNENNESYLAAYIVTEAFVENQEVKTWLESKLPYYMVPAVFVQIDEIPLTHNGKTDRKKLTQIEGNSPNVQTEYIAPRNQTEIEIANIWEHILNTSEISIAEDFFLLGGNSLNATLMINAINKSFGIRLSLQDVFENRSIIQLADLISSSQPVVVEGIEKISEKESYEMSAAQKRFWLLSQVEEANVALNMFQVFSFEGDLDIEIFQKAFLNIIKRHENLRTTFKLDTSGNCKQYITDFAENLLTISQQDLRKEGYTEEKINECIEQEIRTPFDLENGPLLRLKLFRIKDNKQLFSFTMHHIISDGWSMNLIVKEFVNAYKELSKGAEIAEKPLKIQYKDYAAWELEQRQLPSYKKQEEYWKNRFKGKVPVLDIPTDYPRKISTTYLGKGIEFSIEKEVLTEFKELCDQRSVTLYMGLLAVVKTLLHKYSGQLDITVGTPIAGRQHPDLEKQIGLYLNTAPLRTIFDSDENFESLLDKIKTTTIEAHQNQMIAFDELVMSLDIMPSRNRHPLFDVWFVLRDAEIELSNQDLEIEGLNISEYQKADLGKSQFDLVFNFLETDKVLSGRIGYNSDLYQDATIQNMVDNFTYLINSVLSNSNVLLKKISYVDVEERNKLLNIFNNTQKDYTNEPQTLIGLFAQQAQKTPDQVALVFGDDKMTYAQLDEVSSRMGNYLSKKHGIGEGNLVGVKLQKSEWGIICLLGILKSGGVYVPIDIEYPEERIDYIIENSDCQLVIDEDELYDFDLMSKLYSTEFDTQSIHSDQLAYVIYTSGSTGMPKGVEINHGAITNTILSQIEIFENQNQEKGLQLASFSFDASISEIFTVIASGGELHIISDELKKDIRGLEQYITDQEIDFATISPSFLKLMDIKNIKRLKKLVTAGEAAVVEDVTDFVNQGGTCFNAFGPTESSICATIHRLEGKIEEQLSNISIGKPIANTHILILDKNENILPIGMVGEIHISGNGLANGYLGRSELTAQKFINHPFIFGEKLYKTGDLGKWLHNGTIEYLGRNDDQVKVRGYRIELGEIESVLRSNDFIKDTVVLAKEDHLGIKELVAFLMSEESVSAEDIRDFLEERLPDYMVPSHFIIKSEFPLTINGKIDKKQLLKHQISSETNSQNYVAPRNEVEEKLVLLWEEILEKEKVGVLDDFFKIGGHSLKATYLIARIKSEFDIKFDLTEVFNNPTIEKMANEIDKSVLVNKELELEEDFESISI